MTIQEFSDNFTTLLNSYAVIPPFGSQSNPATVVCNEYEKSVFLTKTQEEIVLSLYNGHNIEGKSFEETEELRRYLDSLVKTVECTTYTSETLVPVEHNSVFYTLPDNVLAVTMEQAIYSSDNTCINGLRVNVKPVTQDEYNVIRNNPFRGATKHRVLRLDCGKTVLQSEREKIVPVVELVSKYDIDKYIVRYLEKPEPIILEDLTDTGLSIEGETNAQTCKLNSILHNTILERAVLMALRVKGINTENK